MRRVVLWVSGSALEQELMSLKKYFHFQKGERGTSTVEAAITLFMFMILIFGIMETGRLMSVQQTLVDAAREGARRSVAPYAGTGNLPTSTEVQQEVERFLDSNAIQGYTVNIEPSVIDADGDVHTRITASVPYDFVLTSWFTGSSLTLNGIARMRHETSP